MLTQPKGQHQQPREQVCHSDNKTRFSIRRRPGRKQTKQSDADDGDVVHDGAKENNIGSIEVLRRRKSNESADRKRNFFFTPSSIIIFQFESE